jgi:hypothetical protein
MACINGIRSAGCLMEPMECTLPASEQQAYFFLVAPSLFICPYTNSHCTGIK